jgi:hypothetical protein
VKPGENYYDYRAESGGHTYVREVMRPNEKPMKDKIKVAIQKPSVDNGKKKSVKKATK